MVSILWLIIVSCMQSASNGEKTAKDILQLSIEHRRYVNYGEISCNTIFNNIEVKHVAGNLRSITDISGNDIIHKIIGNDDGCKNPNQIGYPNICSEERFLRTGNEIWRKDEYGLNLTSPPHSYFVDPYTLGFFCIYRGYDLSSCESWCHENKYPVVYSIKDDNGLYTVSQQVNKEYGTEFLEWQIDSKRDYIPVQCSLLYNGEVVRSCRTEYKQNNEIWFPSKSIFSTLGQDDVIVDVTSADIYNIPDSNLLPTFTLSSIGVVAGMSYYDEEQQQILIFNGASLISKEEFDQSVKDKIIDMEPLRKAKEELVQNNKGRYPKSFYTDDNNQIMRNPDLWEKFVNTFIITFSLNQEQINRANKFLKLQRNIAKKYLSKHKKDIDDINNKFNIAIKEKGKSPKAISEIKEQRKDEINKIYSPVDDIFNKKLKPFLFKLLTDKQKSEHGDLTGLKEENQNAQQKIK